MMVRVSTFSMVLLSAGALFAQDSLGTDSSAQPVIASVESVLNDSSKVSESKDSVTTPPPVVTAVPLVSTDAKSIFQRKIQALQDSINALQATIVTERTNVESTLPALRPKDEFEPSDAFNNRKVAWEKDRDQKAFARINPLQQKVQALQGALAQAQKSAGDYQGTLYIASEPEGASVRIDGRAVGQTPLRLEHLWAGSVNLELHAEGYLDYISQVQIKGDSKTNVSASLQEKSIFSQGNEVNLSALLTPDTPSVVIYQARIGVLQARIAEVDAEIVDILSGLAQKNPLTPKGEFEQQADFQKRQEAWKNAGQQLYVATQGKHQAYRAKLQRAIEVLDDYILAQGGKTRSITVDPVEMALGTYNADQQVYPFVIEHREDSVAFRYDGQMNIPIDAAKALNKQTTSLTVVANYFDIPVRTTAGLRYPAWSNLMVSEKGKNYTTQGTFRIPGEWMNDPLVSRTVARADSLRKGLIEVRGLGPDYALNSGSAAKGHGRTWLYVVRGVLFASAATGFTYAYLQHHDAQKESDNFNPKNYGEALATLDDIHAKDKRRNEALIAGGALTLVGAVTFCF